MSYRICIVYYTRVSCHEAVNIGPYLQVSSIERCCQYGSCIVASSTSQICYLFALLVLGNETWHYNYPFLAAVEEVVYQPVCLFVCKDMLAVLYLSLYELA